MKFLETIHSDLAFAYREIYQQCGFQCNHTPVSEPESSAYGGYNLNLNDHVVKFRVAKTTPTKLGQFVTLWKRDTPKGPIQPYDLSDELDLFVISVKEGSQYGQFVFPKTILAQKDILSVNGKGGKRAMRVYPPWTKTTSKQASNTQNWQKNYFISLSQSSPHLIDFTQVRRLYASCMINIPK